MDYGATLDLHVLHHPRYGAYFSPLAHTVETCALWHDLWPGTKP